MQKIRYSEAQRLEQIIDLLDKANGEGLVMSDVAKSLGLSRKRTYDLLEKMTWRGDIIKCKVEGAPHHFGLFLYFHLYHFEKLAGEKIEIGQVYTLRQRTIFELIGH